MDVRYALPGLADLAARTAGSPEITVAVLDGPVDLAHPCFSGADLTRIPSLVTDEAGTGSMSLHGTHVTSLLFGQPGTEVEGLVPRCRGLVIPIFSDGASAKVPQLDIARAIESAMAAGADIISLSGGQRAATREPDSLLGRVLQQCADHGVAVVAAVGNDGCRCIHVPAAVPSVIAVGAAGLDGLPLEHSNWGDDYHHNGVLAPGQEIRGAAPGGGTRSLTGSSFATPIVSGVIALLTAERLALGASADPVGVGRALVASAMPCTPADGRDCRRYLAGTVDVAAAHHYICEGALNAVTESAVVAADAASENVVPSSATTGAESPVATVSPGPAAVAAPPLVMPSISTMLAESDHSGGVRASGDTCGCKQETAPEDYVFAIGQMGFDFGTEARRDTFRQLMPRVLVPGTDGQPDSSLPPNPYDVVQLFDYLESAKWESTKLIWTLNLDLTPVYALEAGGAYAEDVYSTLRAALRNGARPTTDLDYVSRVSVPGRVTGRTCRLFSGQVLPVIEVHPRGLFSWEETALVDEILEAIEHEPGDFNPDWTRLTIRAFLDKIYNQLRNLGRNPADRALNYAATNAFTFAAGVGQGLLSARNMPGDNSNLYTLDTISVSKSPYGRIDSDCWDVQVTFFDPESDQRARAVYEFTIDVSDDLPVSVAPTRQYLIAH